MRVVVEPAVYYGTELQTMQVCSRGCGVACGLLVGCQLMLGSAMWLFVRAVPTGCSCVHQSVLCYDTQCISTGW
jgi:hypothetical protein